MSKAGEFEISVSEPYPCWCSLKYGEKEIRFSHRELSDLKYAVDKAMQEARLKLPGRQKDEV